MIGDVFTRFFDGRTVLLIGAQPIFNSRKKPARGDRIYAKDGSVLQVQIVENKLVEVVVEGPPRPEKLPSSWYMPPSIYK